MIYIYIGILALHMAIGSYLATVHLNKLVFLPDSMNSPLINLI